MARKRALKFYDIPPAAATALTVGMADILREHGLPAIGPDAERILCELYAHAFGTELPISESRRLLETWFVADQRRQDNEPVG